MFQENTVYIKIMLYCCATYKPKKIEGKWNINSPKSNGQKHRNLTGKVCMVPRQLD